MRCSVNNLCLSKAVYSKFSRIEILKNKFDEGFSLKKFNLVDSRFLDQLTKSDVSLSLISFHDIKICASDQNGKPLLANSLLNN